MSNKTETRAGSGEVLYRSFAIDSGAIGSNGDRQVEICFASQEKVSRAFGNEVLVCDAEACDLTRLNQSAAVLSEHSVERQIGVVVPGTARFDSDRKGRALIKFSRSTLGEQEWQDVKDGVRSLVSVGYQVSKYNFDEDTDTYLAVEWEALELSIVAIPADLNCGVGRSKFMQTKTTESNGGADSGADNHRVLEKERARIASLRDLGRKYSRDFGVTELDVDQAIKEGISAKDFCAAILERYEPTAVRNFALGDNPLENRSNHGSFGEQVVNSREYRSLGGRGLPSPGAKLIVELPNASYSTLRRQVRTTLTGLPNTAVQIVEGVPGALGLETPRVADLPAQLTATTGSVAYIKESAFTNAAVPVGEGLVKALQDFSLAEVNTPVRKIATYSKFSEEVLADHARLQQFIDEKMRTAVGVALDTQIVSGPGTGVTFTGVLATSGIQTQARSTDTNFDAIHKAITKVRSVGFYEPDAVVVNPTNWESMRLLKTATDGQYYGGGPMLGAFGSPYVMWPTIWGLPAIVTTAIASGTSLVGAWKAGSQLYWRQGITLEIARDADDFTKNILTVRCELRAAFAVVAPLAFCSVTGMN